MRFLINQPKKENAVGYCCYKGHKGYLSVKMMKSHECLRKQCPCLTKLDHPYWIQRERIKQLKKEKRGAG